MKSDFESKKIDHNSDLSGFERFSIVIGAGINQNVAKHLSAYLRPKNIPFIWCRSLGLLGYVRICVGDHEIRHDHAENAPYDFR